MIHDLLDLHHARGKFASFHHDLDMSLLIVRFHQDMLHVRDFESACHQMLALALTTHYQRTILDMSHLSAFIAHMGDDMSDYIVGSMHQHGLKHLSLVIPQNQMAAMALIEMLKPAGKTEGLTLQWFNAHTGNDAYKRIKHT